MKYFITVILLAVSFGIYAQYNTDIQGTINATGYYLNGQPLLGGAQSFYEVVPGNGNGLRFWQSDWYKIHMGIGGEYQFGPVTDYSIKMNMNSTPGRGWTWGIHGEVPVAAIANNGNMQIAGSFTANGDLVTGIDGGTVSGLGSRLHFLGASSNSDPLWMARYNNGNNSSELRVNIGDDNIGDDAFTLGNIFYADGQWRTFFKVLNNGNVAIGSDSPSNLQGWERVLDVRGNEHAKILTSLNNGDYRTGIYSHNPSWHGGGGFVGTESNHNLHLITNYDPKVSILTNGNVGVGKTDPSFKLDVAGPINATALNVNGQPFVGSKWTSSGSNIYYTAGKVGIGTPLTTNPNNYTLAVNGKIGTKDVQIEAGSTTWPDYVFEPNYELPSLEDVEKYILANKHLEGVPKAGTVEKDGYSVGELNVVLLRKLEEMTLYMIQQQKQINELKTELGKLKN